MPHIWGLFGDNDFNACLVVVNISRAKTARGEHPSGVGCGFCSEQPTIIVHVY